MDSFQAQWLDRLDQDVHNDVWYKARSQPLIDSTRATSSTGTDLIELVQQMLETIEQRLVRYCAEQPDFSSFLTKAVQGWAPKLRKTV